MSSFLNVVLKESPLDSPFAPKKKPFLTLLSSFVNLAGQQDTNSMNAQLQHEQMEQDRITNETNWAINRDQFNRNMQWLREQFYKQRQYQLDDRSYNSPENQVQRLLRAGINPSGVVGAGGSSQPVSSVGGASASTPSSIGAGRSAPYSWSPFSFGSESEFVDFINSVHQNQLVDAQRDKTINEGQIAKANAFTQFTKNLMELRKLYADTEESLSRKDLNYEQRNFLVKQREDLENRIDLFMKSFDSQVEAYDLQNRRVKREIEHYDFQEDLDAKQFEINVDLAKAGITLNQAQSALALAQSGKVAAEQYGIEYNQEIASAAKLVASKKEELDAAMQRYGTSKLAGPILSSSEYKAYKEALKHYHKKLLYSQKHLDSKSRR